jgi:hypothetical protein
VPATLQKIHYHRDVPVHMVYRRPHIAVNLYGDVRYRVFAFSVEIVGSWVPGSLPSLCSSVFWAPPFEGPLKAAPDLVEKFFDAYIAFGQAMQTLSDE